MYIYYFLGQNSLTKTRQAVIESRFFKDRELVVETLQRLISISRHFLGKRNDKAPPFLHAYPLFVNVSSIGLGRR